MNIRTIPQTFRKYIPWVWDSLQKSGMTCSDTGNGGDYYRYEHLLDSFTNMCYLVSVDEFQHKVFEGPQPDAMGLRKIWKAIEEKRSSIQTL